MPCRQAHTLGVLREPVCLAADEIDDLTAKA
jgi:hypothetical protein